MESRIKTELIIEFMNEHNLSKAEFCRMCRMGRCSLDKIMNNDFNFYLCVLARVASVMGYNVKEMFD